METIVLKINAALHSIVWGPFMLVLMVGIGIFFTLRLHFFQVSHFGKSIKNVFQKPESTKKNKQAISPFQAASTSLAGCIGTGNIVGVATALVSGGPGALFWMWVSAFFGMMTKYAEIVLSVHFRSKNEKGESVGGPMYYIEKGLKLKWLAVIFAACCAFASFGIGNMSQINSISTSFQKITEVNGLVIGITCAAIVGIVIIGGIKRIAQISSIIVPFFALAYIIGSGLVLVFNASEIPSALARVVSEAFSLRSVGSGIFGYAIMNAMRFGIARGIFSNEAGLGSAPLAHAASHDDNPVREGLWGIFEVFFDTIVICTMTALIILISGQLDSGQDGADLTLAAFGTFFNSQLTDIFLTISITFFAFSTLIGWSYYGERSVEYLFKSQRAVVMYKFLFVACVVLGATMKLELVWNISDTLNGMMAIPNLVALLGLSGTVIQLTREYKKNSTLEK